MEAVPLGSVELNRVPGADAWEMWTDCYRQNSGWEQERTPHDLSPPAIVLHGGCGASTTNATATSSTNPSNKHALIKKAPHTNICCLGSPRNRPHITVRPLHLGCSCSIFGLANGLGSLWLDEGTFFKAGVILHCLVVVDRRRRDQTIIGSSHQITIFKVASRGTPDLARLWLL